jgi:L-iditol 2-dehydrogenase
MKVARWYNNQDIRIEEMPKPAPGPEDILIKVIACGLCGSDIVEWYRLPRAPLIPGHEIGGVVIETGASVTGYHPGDRVFAAPKVPCLKCAYCWKGQYPLCTEIKDRLPGGFAEYILVPGQLVAKGTVRLPDRISYEQSTFIEPLACVVRAQTLAAIHEGQTVLVLGCGMSGLLHIKLAKAKKCSIVAVDINAKKLEYARKFGADLAISAGEEVPEILLARLGKQAEVVILCTSALPAVQQAWQCLDKGGTVVFFAVPDPDKKVEIPINYFWMREVKILTSYYCGPPDIKEAINLIESKSVTVEDLITHKLPLMEIARGFQLALEGKDAVKVLIEP